MITNENGCIVATGNGVEIFRLLSLRGRVKLEGLGLKSRINTTALLMKEYGLPGKATKANRAKVLAEIEKKLDELKKNP